MRKFLYLIVFAAFSGCDNTPPTPLPNDKTVFELINNERVKQKLQKLVENQFLYKEAQRYSELMAKSNTLSHDLDGNFGTRIRKSGYLGTEFGENIAMGYTTPASVVAGWMNSAGHRANILNPRFKDFGSGAAKNSKGQIFWTNEFGH